MKALSETLKYSILQRMFSTGFLRPSIADSKFRYISASRVLQQATSGIFVHFTITFPDTSLLNPIRCFIGQNFVRSSGSSFTTKIPLTPRPA